MFSRIAISAIRGGFRFPSGKVRAFDHLSRTVDLLRTLKIDLVLDVGANRGFYSKHLRSAGYDGRIVSFEPIGSDCDQIRRMAAPDSKWNVCNFALGNENGQKTFNLFEAEGQTVLSSFLPIDGSASCQVEIRRLDDVLPELLNGAEHPRIFLKMDTQGYDPEVIKGASSVLSDVVLLQSEIPVIHIYAGMKNYLECLADYHAMGFDLLDLFPVDHTPDGRVIEYDCLMKRSARA